MSLTRGPSVRVLADTNIFVYVEGGKLPSPLPAQYEVAASVVTLGELHWGLLAGRDSGDLSRRLHTYLTVRDMDVIPIDEGVAERWGALMANIRESGRRGLKANDSWLAATAIAEGVPILTVDGDFEGVPDLTVERIEVDGVTPRR
jgi:predicted nucleic acid-binding protein